MTKNLTYFFWRQEGSSDLLVPHSPQPVPAQAGKSTTHSGPPGNSYLHRLVNGLRIECYLPFSSVVLMYVGSMIPLSGAVCVCTHLCGVYVCVYVCAPIYVVCMFVCVCMYMVYVYIHAYVCMYVCVCVCEGLQQRDHALRVHAA